ncbi:pilus assembly protein PilP [Yersinia rohdei]|uniref:pilus assembly protein PilP n=1 Tax=Yersinia rohdei TaxID=29485 RepID=UPI0021BDE199|nr:pilus assembly protein PilP [Yersinia rohdei]
MSCRTGGPAMVLWLARLLLIAVLWGPTVSAESLSAAYGRDPFQQISAQSCGDDREKLANWQLQGIVHGNQYHSAWVQHSEGQWQKLVTGTPLLPYWQVTHISSRQVSLEHVNPDRACLGLSGAVVLSMK